MTLRLSIAAAAALLLTASIPGAQAQNSAQSSPTPKRGGNFVLGVYVGEPDNFDCHRSTSGSSMYRVAPSYSTLVQIDPAHYPNVAPDLAKSWNVSPDGLTYTFNLNTGVKFHDGSDFSSADIKATYDRIRKPPEGVVSFRAPLYRDISAIDTPDANTVVFKLSKPNAAMLSLLASPYNCVYSAKKLAEDPKFPERNVMGTGPFKFVSYTPGGDWKVERFAAYFKKGQPYLDSVTIPSASGQGLINALAAGQVMMEFRGLASGQIDLIKAQRGDKVRVESSEQPGFLLITFNTEKPPFNDARVRRALNLAIDRWSGSAPMAKSMIFNRVGGFQRIGTPFGPTKEELQKLPGFRPDMAANRAEAKKLLAEAGQSDLKFTLLNRQDLTPLGIYLIDQWRQIGVTVTQDQPENQRFFSSLLGGNYEALIDASQDYIDEPSLQFAPFLPFPGNKTNRSRSNDPKVQELYDRQAAALNVADRKKAVNELTQYLAEQSYSVPLFWVLREVIVPTNVHNFHMSPSSLLGIDLSDMWIDQ
jgi:peptide/nickel transport system substrate-binding protein